MILETLSLHHSSIVLGCDCLAEALAGLSLSSYSSVFLISQERVWDLHGSRLAPVLDGLSPKVQLQLIPDGETTKNLGQFQELLSWLASHSADRKSAIIVLGGGVVGDLSGFVASAYMRGIDWIYLPTTLLAQQDASVGGKVAVNLPQGKNLVGHFWEPRAVIIDSATLSTLPLRELNAGYMEFVKHAMLHSPELYAAACALEPGRLDGREHLALLGSGLKVKLGIVSRDPLEKGERRLLNLGHTLGHAIESYTQYTQFLHGEAVGLGLIYATLLGQKLGSSFDWSALIRAVRLRLPAFSASAWDPNQLLQLTLLDKKGVKGRIPWIVPMAPGQVEIVDGVDEPILRAALTDFLDLMG